MTDQSLEAVALADVIVDINVRTDIKLDKSFVSSIRNHGIIQPPVGWRDVDGKIHITTGQRRTLAAKEIGLELIDVVVKPQEIAEAARVVTQLTENDQRQELTDSERLHGYKQLAMFGISIDQIARKTNKPKAHVETAMAVSQSKIATDALAAMPIDFEQAAAIAEFEDDPEAVDRLLQVAAERPQAIAHEAQRIRDLRAFKAAKAAREEQLVAEGWEILTSRPSWEDSTIKSLRNLWHAGDDTHEEITVDQAVTFDGHAAYVTEPDWEAREAGETTSTIYYIRGWKDQGLATYDTGSNKGPLTDEDKAERKAQRELTADLKSATVVRREWIRGFLANTKRIHSDKALYAAAIHTICATVLQAGFGHAHPDKKAYTLAAELLDIETEGPDQWSADSPARRELAKHLDTETDPIQLALAVAIANYERIAGDPTIKWIANDDRTKVYFAQLQEWGYTPADVELQIIAGKQAGSGDDQ